MDILLANSFLEIAADASKVFAPMLVALFKSCFDNILLVLNELGI
jgi:hypothetical protein